MAISVTPSVPVTYWPEVRAGRGSPTLASERMKARTGFLLGKRMFRVRAMDAPGSRHASFLAWLHVAPYSRPASRRILPAMIFSNRRSTRTRRGPGRPESPDRDLAAEAAGFADRIEAVRLLLEKGLDASDKKGR